MKSSAELIQSAFFQTRKPLLQLLKRRLGCVHTAEDLVQETYLRAIQQESIAEIGNLSAYLFRIASNLMIDYGRQAVTKALVRDEPLEEDLVCPRPLPDRIVESSQEIDLLAQLIAELPPQCRRIFLLHKVERLTQAEVAEQLGISPRTVEKQICKALRILRDRMQAQCG
jgi:RNA polymerase sigma factor (sigma-70 family)